MKGRFYIAGKDKQSVTGVGCRIKVYREILETPSLKNGIARNADKNKVEILVEAEGNNAKDALEDFRKKVMTLELPDVSANPGFYVTELDIRFSEEPLSLMRETLHNVQGMKAHSQIQFSLDSENLKDCCP